MQIKLVETCKNRSCVLFFVHLYLPTTLFLISNVAYVSATTIDIAQMIFVHDDDLGRTKKGNPCNLVPLANSRNTFKTTISNWNLTEMQHHINLLSFTHWLIFDFLSKKYLRQVKNLKIWYFRFQPWFWLLVFNNGQPSPWSCLETKI